MSYDLDLFVPQVNIDPLEIIQSAAFIKADPSTPLNIELANDLLTDNPQFEYTMTPETIELIDPHDGITIRLHSHTASISVPYWHTDKRAINLAIGTARRYLRTILRKSNFAVYDAQLGKMVDLEKDSPQMIAKYEQSLAGMTSLFG